VGATFNVLGELEVRVDGVDVTLAASKERNLLAMLAVNGGRMVSTEHLLDELWPGQPPERARPSLHVRIAGIRKALGRAGAGALLVSTAAGYRLDVPADAVDAERFRLLVREARSRRDEGDAAGAAAALASALGLWRGDPLADAHDSVELEAVSARLTDERLDAIEDWADAELVGGHHNVVFAEVTNLADMYPWRERLWRQRMICLYRAGRQADALAVAKELRRRLVDELGLDPSPELAQLERAILNHDLPPASKAAITSLPPLRIPSPTPLIGRGEVVGEITALLASSRLVTLTGPGGVGKTSIAAAVVNAASSKFPDGTAWADLSVLKPDGDVVQVISDACAVSEERGGSLLGALTGALEDRRVLLVADNCEHVLDGVVSVVEAILAADVEAVVLCTSREPLALGAEEVVTLRPLGFDGEDSPAVELLRTRMGTFSAETQSELAEMVDLAARLEGLPLALELAAARCRSLGVKDVNRLLAGRFDLLADRHRSPRHRSLDAALSWSYELLQPDEQAVFQRLSVFAGAFTLEAAERVAACEAATAIAVDDAIAGLVDKSMLLRSNDRFRLLDSTRTFAARLLAASGFEAARSAHLALMVDRAAEIRTGVRGPDEKRWVAVVDAEWPDVRVAVDRAFELDDADAVISLVVDLAWEIMYRRPEGLPWIEEAVRRYGDSPGPRRRDLLGAGCLPAFLAGEITEGVRRADLMLALESDPGANLDALPEALAAGAYHYAGQHESGVAACRRALDRAGAQLEPVDQALLLTNIALGSLRRSREEAVSTGALARDIAVAWGNPSLIAYTALNYATVHPLEAAVALDQAHRAASEVGNRFYVLIASEVTARLQRAALRRGASPDDASRAVSLFIAVCRDYYREGRLAHAHVVGRELAGLLLDLDRPEAAAAVLGGCDAAGTIAIVTSEPLPAALAELSRGGGSDELRRSYELGRRTRFTDLLRLAEESNSSTAS
jgi:predicted ATPase/DNA-binding SARP family transcriptional activator